MPTIVPFARPQGAPVAAAPTGAPRAPVVTPQLPQRIPPATIARGNGRVEIWDMSSGVEQPLVGATLLRNDDAVVSSAFANAVKVDEFLRNRLNRNGWDGKGAPVRVVVHAPNEDGTLGMNNAYWDNRAGRIYFGDGDGTLFAPLAGALDVAVHEATHAIVDSEVNLRYEGQSGGINESWADVLASLADDADWTIGEDVFTPGTAGDAIRDLENPRFGHVSKLPKGALLEPHDYSGIPSLAAVRVAGALGREAMGRIWYSALIDHMDSRSGFAGAARATLDAAVAIHGASSSVVGSVLDAWKSVGVDPRWTRPT